VASFTRRSNLHPRHIARFCASRYRRVIGLGRTYASITFGRSRFAYEPMLALRSRSDKSAARPTDRDL